MKSIFKIILLIGGIFSLLFCLISIVSIKDMGLSDSLIMFIIFGIISFICFFFSRDLFSKSINDYNKIKNNLDYVNNDLENKKTEIKEKEEEINKLELRLHELSGEVNGLYKTKEKLEAEMKKYKETIGEYKKEINNYTIEKIDKMEGIDFEKFTADLLKQLGYENVKTTPASNDFGVDVLAEKSGVKYAIQCKNYSSDLGGKPIQEVIAGKNYYGCHVGVVVTNRSFTANAVALAKKNNVLLWDRNKLIKMIKTL